MPLVDKEIIRALNLGHWNATRDGEPVSSGQLTVNPSSVNVSLHHQILEIVPKSHVIDLHNPDSFKVIAYNCTDGHPLYPGHLYLGAVRESFDCAAPLWIEEKRRHFWGGAPIEEKVLQETETYFYPKVDGRSTTGRCGLGTHITAGHGDWCFGSGESLCSVFTLELTVIIPTWVRRGDEVAQIFFEPLQGAPSQRYSGAYTKQADGPRLPVLGKERFQR